MQGGVPDGLATFATMLGSALLLFLAFWITYGVFVRYALSDPDRFVTEGASMLLLGLAYAGLPAALRDDSFPKATFALAILPQRAERLIRALNMTLMACVGIWFTLAASKATFDTFRIGQTSYITGWPEYLAWLPASLFTATFAICACAKVWRLVRSEWASQFRENSTAITTER